MAHTTGYWTQVSLGTTWQLPVFIMNRRFRAVITALSKHHGVSLLKACEILEEYEYGLRVPLSRAADPLVHEIPAHRHAPYQPFSCWQYTGFVSVRNLFHQVRVRHLDPIDQDISLEALLGDLGRKNVSIAGAALVRMLTDRAAHVGSEEASLLPCEEGSVLYCPDLYVRHQENAHVLHRPGSEPFLYRAYFSRGRWWWRTNLPDHRVSPRERVSVIEIVSSCTD